MGYIREAEGVDFVVNTEPISPLESLQISDVISHYKKTGEIKKILPSKEETFESGNDSCYRSIVWLVFKLRR